MIRTALAAALIATLGGSARAETCEQPLVVISGDDEVVRAIEVLLASRGIALADGTCTTIRAHVEKRDGMFAISIRSAEGRDDAAIDRTVGELETAATVIESFTRDDAAPLLPVRAKPARIALVELARPAVAAEPVPTPSRRVQVFTGVETSVGSDHTNWMGAFVGINIPIGPINAAARTRHAAVVAGEGMWESAMQRRSTEILLGIDIPFSLGRTTLSPGFAAGMGSMWTRSSDGATVGETGGLRADVHATLSVPISKKWAVDLSAALDLTQETRIESEVAMAIPDEPIVLLRFGLGIRYGAFK